MSSSTSTSASSSHPGSGFRFLTSSDYTQLGRLVELHPEAVARRLTGQRFNDFKVGQLKDIVKFLKSHPLYAHINQIKLASLKTALIDSLRAAYAYQPNSASAPPPPSSTSLSYTSGTHPHPLHSQYPNVYPPTSQSQSQSNAYPYSHQSDPRYPTMPHQTTGYSEYKSSSSSRSPYPSHSNGSSYPPYGSSSSSAYPQSYNYPHSGTDTLPSQHQHHQAIQSQQQPYRPSSSSSSSSSSYTPVNADQLQRHPNFTLNRNPYDGLVQVLGTATLPPHPHAATSHSQQTAEIKFTASQHTLHKIRSSSSSTYNVHLRLFSGVYQHVQWDKQWRVRVNGHEIPIPEPKKLSKVKKKGLELVRPLEIKPFISQHNHIIVESIRTSFMTEPFRGIVVAELIKQKETKELMGFVERRCRERAVALSGDSATNGGKAGNGDLLKLAMTKHKCGVCGHTEELLRCSRCKNQWYCGEAHQREHWPAHRTTCVAPTPEQEKARLEEDKRIAAATAAAAAAAASATASPSTDAVATTDTATGAGAGTDAATATTIASTTTTTTSGRTKLRMPVKPKKEADAGSDSDDDAIMEVDTLVSLKCPLSLERIVCAARGLRCMHLPCFDVQTFIMFSAQSGVWQCPLCYRALPFEEIEIDDAMNAVLKENDEEITQIRVHPETGEYEPIKPVEEPRKKKRKHDHVSSSASVTSSSTTPTPVAIPSSSPNTSTSTYRHPSPTSSYVYPPSTHSASGQQPSAGGSPTSYYMGNWDTAAAAAAASGGRSPEARSPSAAYTGAPAPADGDGEGLVGGTTVDTAILIDDD